MTPDRSVSGVRVRVLKADGRVCCSGRPANFCPACKQAHAEGRSPVSSAAAAPHPLSQRLKEVRQQTVQEDRVATFTTNQYGAPNPPSVVKAICRAMEQTA